MSDEENEKKEANLEDTETSTLLLGTAPDEASGEEGRLLYSAAMDSDDTGEKPRPPPPSYDQAVAKTKRPPRYTPSPQRSQAGSLSSLSAYSSEGDGARRARSVERIAAQNRSRDGSRSNSQPPTPPSRSSSIEVMNRLKGTSHSDISNVTDFPVNRGACGEEAVNPIYSEAVTSLGSPQKNTSTVSPENGASIELTTLEDDKQTPETQETSVTDVPAVGFTGSAIRRTSMVQAIGATNFSASLEHVEAAGDDEDKSWRRWVSGRRRVLIIVGCVGSLCLLMFLALFPVSFVTVEYYELALKRIRSTRVLERNDTYYFGCYVIGPDAEFMKFPSTAQTLTMDLSSFTVERLHVDFSVSLQFFLRSEEIGELYLKFGPDYHRVLALMVEAALKNRMIRFTLDELKGDRANVEIDLHQTAHRKLAGTCCLPCCKTGSCAGRQIQLCVGCRTSSCDKGYHAEVRYFQLGDLTMPQRVTERILKQLVLQVEAETEYFKQDRTLTELHTEKMVQDKQNQANEISSNATAWGNFITVQAGAEADKTTQQATVMALQQTYDRLDLQQEDHQMSYYWISTLGKKELVRKNGVGFEKYSAYSGS